MERPAFFESHSDRVAPPPATPLSATPTAHGFARFGESITPGALGFHGWHSRHAVSGAIVGDRDDDAMLGVAFAFAGILCRWRELLLIAGGVGGWPGVYCCVLVCVYVRVHAHVCVRIYKSLRESAFVCTLVFMIYLVLSCIRSKVIFEL